MSIFEAFVLGLVQGLSEFLPISSSGHLLLVPWLFGWDTTLDESTRRAFDVSLHLGTLVAVVGYFRAELAVYVRDGVRLVVDRRRPVTPDGRLAWLFVLSAVPAAAAGALFEGIIDDWLGAPAIIGVSLVVFGLVLWWADRREGGRALERFGVRDAVVVGAAQVLALNPGTSRSGITITAARFIGFSRDAAARISFVMSIPIIAGAVVFKIGGLLADGVPEGLAWAMVVGILTSAVSGWFAVWGTIALVRTRSFVPFVVYRVVVGLVVLVVVATGLR